MNRYCRYIVLSHGRTGSTIVTRMLRGHSCVVDYQELFNVNFQAEFRCVTDRATSLRYWLDTFDHAKAPRRPPLTALGSASVETLLDKHVWHDGYAPSVRAVGFKLLHDQMQPSGRFPSLREEVERRLPQLRAVVITRRNLLKQYLSHVMADRVKQWHIPDASCRLPRPRVHLEARQLMGAFEHSRRVEKEFAALAADAESVMHIRYEELVERMSAHWRDLQDFVRAPHEAMPELRLAKIENRTLGQAIANYDELKRHFRGSPWEEFFDE
ncbi:MAG: hypothetical protein B7Z73_02140 [Planctomycetia bacterium 21-64-5]|nr:MAG: hypothetical protein B7Z73_02140 [Planctomycetia bacterium 21-64-5]